MQGIQSGSFVFVDGDQDGRIDLNTVEDRVFEFETGAELSRSQAILRDSRLQNVLYVDQNHLRNSLKVSQAFVPGAPGVLESNQALRQTSSWRSVGVFAGVAVLAALAWRFFPGDEEEPIEVVPDTEVPLYIGDPVTETLIVYAAAEGDDGDAAVDAEGDGLGEIEDDADISPEDIEAEADGLSGAEAAEKYVQAADAFQSLGDDHRTAYLRCLTKARDAYIDAGDKESAVDIASELHISFRDDDEGLKTNLNILVDLHTQLGNWSEVMQALDDTVNILRRQDRHEEAVQAEIAAVLVARNMEDQPEAVRRLALAIIHLLEMENLERANTQHGILLSISRNHSHDESVAREVDGYKEALRDLWGREGLPVSVSDKIEGFLAAEFPEFVEPSEVVSEEDE